MSVIIGVLWGVCLLLSGYAAVCILAWLFRDRLIFHPTPPNSFPPQRWNDKRRSLSRPAAALHGWILPGSNPDGPPVIYLGGNAEDVQVNLDELAKMGCSAVAVFPYRGFGPSTGTPSCQAVIDDAVAVTEHLATVCRCSTNDVVVLGRSLGAAVAVAVAARIPTRGLILVTPFESLRAMARRLAPWFPSMLLHQFDSIRATAQPLPEALFIIAKDDALIPAHVSMPLYHAWPAPAHLLTIPAGGHNGLHMDAEYMVAINRFLASTGQCKRKVPKARISPKVR